MFPRKRIKQFTRRGESNQVERYGKKFQSTTEATMYGALLKLQIPFQWQVKYVLQEPVRKPASKKKIYPLLQESGVWQVKVTVDFEFNGPNAIHYVIDTKGSKEYATEGSRLRYHLLKGQFYREGKTQNQIVFLDYKEVKTLAVLASNPAKFWQHLYSIKPF